MNLIINKVYNTVKKEHMINPGDKILVGFSGGADSVFLMLVLLELKNELDFEIYAAHVNHGIRGDEAKRDENFVKEFCDSKGIRLFTQTMDIPRIASEQKISEESAGRNERYKFFNKILQDEKLNKIAVAHNKNDSVETVILNMIRGSSLKGLGGIRPVNGNVIRPVIDISRDEIENYLNCSSQSYCTDSTNLSDIYTRNKIRHNILKYMTQINDSVVDTIYSNIFTLRDDENFINQYARNLNCIQKTADGINIDKKIFDVQHKAVKKRLIMNAFEALNGNCNNICGNHLDIICNASTSGKKYNMPENTIVTVSFDKIIFSKDKKENTVFEYEIIPLSNLEVLPGIFISGNYCNEYDPCCKDAVFIDADLLKNKTLTVRNRRDGDKFIPYGMKNNKKLKQLFIEHKIPSYKRDEIPLLIADNEIVAVVPYRVSELYKVTDKTKKILKIKLTKEE